MEFLKRTPLCNDPIGRATHGRDVGAHKRKQASKRKPTKLDNFIVEFASELDLFDSDLNVPSWVFDYRDDHIRKMSAKQMAMCRWLKGCGYDFKVKWPIRIEDKWKFADVYMPKQRLVIIFSNAMSNFRPAGLPSYRAEWFKDRFSVIEVEDIDELKVKLEKYENRIG